MILLPGSVWSSADNLVSSGSFAALQTVTNPDGTTTNLVFDIHKYLDSDNSGTHAECVTNNIDEAFSPLAATLRKAGRKAFLTETGGGNVQSCVTYMCQQLAYLNSVCRICWMVGGCVSTELGLCSKPCADFEWEYLDRYFACCFML
jgi:endoglucanase